jgi:hypothetical protein
MAADLQQLADVDAAAGGAPSYLPLRFARLFFEPSPSFPLRATVISTACGKSYRRSDGRRGKIGQHNKGGAPAADGMRFARVT